MTPIDAPDANNGTRWRTRFILLNGKAGMGTTINAVALAVALSGGASASCAFGTRE